MLLLKTINNNKPDDQPTANNTQVEEMQKQVLEIKLKEKKLIEELGKEREKRMRAEYKIECLQTKLLEMHAF